mmetsp:Transcript_3553/g.13798  ORF Transcript_3553/g.13798 Transcript_3553/m.13798 type:complete len:200 (+) Transcript_3553:1707-2306(+)
MRTPPAFSVASLLPCTVQPPCSSRSTQSPWRHASPRAKSRSKYAARYAVPASSPSNHSGAVGKAERHASSPGAPGGIDSSPVAASRTSTSRPSALHWSVAVRTASHGLPVRKLPLRSVPPLVDTRGTSGLSRASQRNARGEHGDPVTPKTLASSASGNLRSAVAHAARCAAELPKTPSTPASAATSQSVAGPRANGSPS